MQELEAFCSATTYEFSRNGHDGFTVHRAESRHQPNVDKIRRQGKIKIAYTCEIFTQGVVFSVAAWIILDDTLIFIMIGVFSITFRVDKESKRRVGVRGLWVVGKGIRTMTKKR